MKKWIMVFPLLAFFLLQKKASKASTQTKTAFFTNPLEPFLLRNDDEGHGNFGTKRKGHTHRGIDFLVTTGQQVVSPCTGNFVRTAKPYANDNRLSGCVLQADTGEIVKIFYIQPILSANTKINKGDIIGIAQDVRIKYNSTKMLQHIHLEIWRNGVAIDPKNYFKNG